MSALQPSQVTANANSKMLRIERLVEARHIPTPRRMVAIARIVEEFEAAVEGSTADPFRASRDDARRVEASAVKS